MSALDSFTPLEDLIQVIYQGLNRFVLLSKVDFDSLVKEMVEADLNAVQSLVEDHN